MDPTFLDRILKYSEQSGLTILLDQRIGHGSDGQIWRSSQESAIKVFHRSPNYEIEKACYQRLQTRAISIINGFHVPCLYAFDDELCIIEMSIVSPPFLLDFGKCYLDHPPDYSEEVMEEDEEYRRELFEDRWPEVQKLLWKLESIGIYYMDARPANIAFD